MPDLPAWGFDEPGPLRDRLNEAVLLGRKTATTSLYVEGDEIPRAGTRELLVDSSEEPVALIEIDWAEVRRIADIDLEIAIAEGEGYETVAAWRASHERYFLDEQLADGVDPGPALREDTRILVEWFHVLKVF